MHAFVASRHLTVAVGENPRGMFHRFSRRVATIQDRLFVQTSRAQIDLVLSQ